MRVQVSGTSESTAVLRSYLHEAGDVVVWKEGDSSEPDYIIHLEERKAQEIYFESIQCDLERDIIRHVRQKAIVPIVLCGTPNNRPKHIIRIVFPPSQSPAVELGVQMGLADYVASKRKAATELVSASPQAADFGKLEEMLGRFVEKLRPADSESVKLAQELEKLYERLLLEKDVTIEKLMYELEETRKPHPESTIMRPWWKFWKWIWVAIFLASFVPIAKTQIYPIRPVIQFTTTNPNGAACTFSSPIQYYQGTQYTCVNNTTYAASGGSSSWSGLTNPTGNLSLTMGADTSLFTFNAATGAATDLFELTDTTNNTGTGNLLRSSTASGSAAAPLRADANGIGWQVNSSGNLINLSTASETISQNGIGTTSTDAAVLSNTTAAAAGAQQFSPRIRLTGQGWKTTATAASQATDWFIEEQPVQDTTNPDAQLTLTPRINAVNQAPLLICSSTTGSPALGLFNMDARTSIVAGCGTNVAVTGIGSVGGNNTFGAYNSSSAPTLNWNTNGSLLGSAKLVMWNSVTNPGANNTGDTGLCRSSAGVLGINDGSATCTLTHFKTAIYGHTLASGTAPTLTAGTGTIIGGDERFRVTLTAGSQTTITVTFGTAYTTNIPVFVCNDETTAVNNPVQAQPTLSTVVINATGTFGAADKISCVGGGIIGI